jgi:hypothetical protein
MAPLSRVPPPTQAALTDPPVPKSTTTAICT